MFPRETILTGAPKSCKQCDYIFEFQVMSSPAGYYVGTSCLCGPYTRETGYFKTPVEAQNAVDLIKAGDLLNPRAKVRG